MVMVVVVQVPVPATAVGYAIDAAFEVEEAGGEGSGGEFGVVPGREGDRGADTEHEAAGQNGAGPATAQALLAPGGERRGTLLGGSTGDKTGAVC